MRNQTKKRMTAVFGITALALLAGVYLTNANQAQAQAKAATQPAVEQATQPSSAAVKPATPQTPDKTILFFMNPNGRPCQIQDAILQELKDTLTPIAGVHYYKTTEGADLAAFGRYGIRSLPSLVIIDAKGKEIKRFTPGIQDKAAILAGLSGQKK